MAVQLVTTEAEFLALKEAWQEIFRSNPAHTPFQTWEWNYAWWVHFGRPGRLRLLLVRQQADLIGIAPLYLDNSYRGLPLRHLAFISSRRADYLDFIVAPRTEETFFHELFEFLRADSSNWRLLTLRDLPESSPNLPHLLAAAGANLPFIDKRPAENCATLPIPASWPGYLAALRPSARRNVVRYYRQLESSFTVRWTAAETAEDAQRLLPDFVSVFRSRWVGEQGQTFFDDPRASAFEADVCRLGSEAGWYRLFMLYLNDRPVAGYLGYVCNNKFYAGLLAHSLDMRSYGVGTVLVGMTIQHGMGKGWTELDMTRGDEPYKLQWNCLIKRNLRIKISSTRAALAYAMLIDSIREQLQRLRLLYRMRATYRRLAALAGSKRPERASPAGSSSAP